MFDFTGKVACVTGAAGNLGGAAAHALHAAGASLILIDRATDRLQEVCGEIASAGSHSLLGGVDLTDPASVQRAVQTGLEQQGAIDILINAIGGFRAGKPLHETPLETFDFMMTLNARTVFITCQAVIPHMLERGSGKIVNTGARAAVAGGSRNGSAYGASKTAVIRLTESMALELRGKGINVNVVLPSTIDTPQNREAMPDADPSQWVAPEAIADVMLFLASDAARAVHGAAVPVYGLS